MLLFLVSCETEEAPVPQLKILNNLPAQISYGDTLIIQFEAQSINSYRIHIMKGNLILGNSFRALYRDEDFFEAQVIFNDRYLEDGNYQLRLSVQNQSEGNSSFHAFAYNGLNLENRGMALLANQKLYFFDEQGQTSREYPVNGNFDLLKISARDSLIYLASLGDDGIEVRHLKDFSLITRIPAPLGAGQQSYSSFVKTENGFYLLRKDGFIKHLESGTFQTSQDFNRQGPNYYAQSGAIINEELAVIFAYPDQTSSEVHYLNESLFSRYSRALVGSKHQIAALDDAALALIYLMPNGNKWAIDRYQGSSQDYGNRGDFNADSVFALTAISASEIVYSSNNGLFRFDLDQGGSSFLVDVAKYWNFQKRRTDQAIFMQKGNLVQRLLLNNNLQFAASINEPLLDYEILYNK